MVVQQAQQQEILSGARFAALAWAPQDRPTLPVNTDENVGFLNSVWTPQDRPARPVGSVTGAGNAVVPANTTERDPVDKRSPAPRALLLAPARAEDALPPALVLEEERLENMGETGRETVARRGSIGDNDEAKPKRVEEPGSLIVPREAEEGTGFPLVFAPDPSRVSLREPEILGTEVRSRYVRVPVVNVLDLVL